jgi:cell division transport system permease protein
MRLGFFTREALRALRRSAAPSFAAVLTIVLTAVVLGVFVPVVQTAIGTADEVRGRVVVDVYVANGASAKELGELRRTLVETPNVAAVEFIPKEEALADEREENPEAFELLGSNPLPDAFRLTPEDPDAVGELVEGLQPPGGAEDGTAAESAAGGKGAGEDGAGGEEQAAGALASIDEVRYREEETDKILSATGLVTFVTGGLSLLLLLASVALVANTIRLSVFARRREIEVMRLVGATSWFIRWPFVIEGMIVGLLGGAVAIGLLYLMKATLVDPLSDQFSLLALPDTIDFRLLVAVLLAACTAVAAVGSGVTLRRFLRV